MISLKTTQLLMIVQLVTSNVIHVVIMKAVINVLVTEVEKGIVQLVMINTLMMESMNVVKLVFPNIQIVCLVMSMNVQYVVKTE
jgi:hypothetical protein